jgi:hypothetical protein
MISKKSAIAVGMLFLFARATLATGTASAPTRYVFNRMDLATGSEPVSVVTGDFNGDGKPDIAVIHQNSTSICVFLANPDSTFRPCISTTITATATIGPSSLVAGDFNGDGQLDLAFVNGSSTVGVLLGNGDGTFAAEKDFAVPGGAVSLATGDLNGDGKLDLVVGAQGGLAAYLGNGDGTFSNSWTLNHTCQVPTVCVQVLLGDFNGDGKLDLVFASPGPGGGIVDVLPGNGDGTFQNVPVATSLAHQASGMARADLNGDGKLDLITADLDGYVSVLIGQGDGSFSVTDYQVGGNCAPCGVPTSVVAADFNGDGQPDVAVTYSGVDPSGILVFLNSGGGALGTPVKYPAAQNSYALAFADFNQDGLADLVVANEGSASVSILIGDSAGTFLSKTPFALPGQGTSLAVGDFNGDGLPDLAVASTSLSAFLGAADGSFHSSYTIGFGTLSATATALGDFNNDGKPDVMLNFPPSSGFQGGAEVFLGNGDGTFSPLSVDTRAGGSAALAVGDFNGDGKLDRAVLNPTANSVSIQLGNGDGTFQAPVSYPTGVGPASIVAGDFNNDGKLDLAVTNNGAGTVSILLGNGDGTFQSHQDYGPIGTAALTSSLAAADFNGDGNLDLAVTTSTTNVAIFLGKGDGTLQAGQLYSVGAHVPSLVTSGDFDADGTIDLAVGFSSVDNFVLLPGNGDGTFQSPGLDFLGYSSVQGGVALAPGKFGSAGGLGLAEILQPSSSAFVFLNKPIVSLFPSTLVFQPQQVGMTSPEESITVYNPGSAQLIVSRIDKTGDFAETDTCTSAPIVPGGNCIITGSFTPTVPGLRTGTFTLTTNAGTGQQVINLSSTQESTLTSLSSSMNPSIYGQSITLTASVTPTEGGSAVGTVTFTDGGSPIGNGTLTSGSATLMTASLSAGPHSLQAVYPANNGLIGSISPVLTQTVNQGSTTIVVSCGSTGIGPHLGTFIDERILCSAVVNPVLPAVGIPTGTVNFFDGGTPIGNGQLNSSVPPGAAGPASIGVGFATAGTHLITAQYLGDTNFAGSTTASAFSLLVSTIRTTLTITCASTASQPILGQPVECSALATPSSPGPGFPTGLVTFLDGAISIGTAPLNNTNPAGGPAVFNTPPFLSAGQHLITAEYAGDATYSGSSTTSAAIVPVLKDSVSLGALNTSFNPSFAGNSITFTTPLSVFIPAGASPLPQITGSVTFSDGPNALGSVPVGPATPMVNGSLLISFTASFGPGQHPISAIYGGDSNYLASSPASLTQFVNKISTTITLASTGSNSSLLGQPVPLTATVGPQGGPLAPTTNVSFFDGATPLGTAPLSGATATFIASGLSVGSHSFTASYGGDLNFNASGPSAPPLAWTVTNPATTTNLAASPNPSVYGQLVTFTATVTSGAGTPGGPVTFSDGATVLGSGTLSPTGVAAFSTPFLLAGTHPITASYAANGNYSGSTSSAVLEVVTPAPLKVTANNNSRLYGQSNPGLSGTITGIANGDNITATYSTSATPASPAGTYAIAPALADPANKLGNYTVTINSGTLTVNPAIVTITANNSTKVLNAPNPAFTPSYSGFVNGDTSSVLTSMPTCTSMATTTSPVGTYSITCSGAAATNYTFSYVSGTLTITYLAGGMCDGDLNHQILQPINADGTSVWKQGRTIPAKFRVCDANGVSAGAPGTVANFALVEIISGTVTTVDETVTSTNADTAFRWDPAGQQWIFNISTSNLSAGYTYVYAITLNDGSVILFRYGLR